MTNNCKVEWFALEGYRWRMRLYWEKNLVAKFTIYLHFLPIPGAGNIV